MIAVAEKGEYLVQLFLGKDAYALAEQKMSEVKKDMEEVRAIATATDFD